MATRMYMRVAESGKVHQFLYSEEDQELVKSRKWAVRPKGYAEAKFSGKTRKLHRLIMAAPPHLQVDHIDVDPFNNTRHNLRLCTNAENQRNTGLRKTNKSGFKGVYWHDSNNKWAAKIRLDGKNRHLGSFASAEEASMAYEKAAKQHYGEFAHSAGGGL